VTLGGKNGLMVNGCTERLGVEKKTHFHTIVAKLLYLSKWACPNIISLVDFLCTRVKEPTIKDKVKLMSWGT
jgi:hypothetical protein